MKPIVSAVIPVYNGAAYITEMLRSLLQQSRPFDEILVVDDGSTDATVKLVKQFRNVKLIRSRHVERIVTRNIGWKAAKGDIIAFVDSDIVLEKQWLKNVLVGFEKGYSAVVDRRAVYKPKTYVAKMNDHYFDVRYAAKYKPFTLWVIQRDVLVKVGGLDPRVVGFEDREIADRVRAHGYEIYFAKNAIAYHKGEPSTVLGELRRHFWFGAHAWPYWRVSKRVKKPLQSLLFLVITIVFFVRPVVALVFVAFAYGYVLLRDVQRKMQMEYVFVHPLIAVLSEFAYAYGVVSSFVGKPLERVRKS